MPDIDELIERAWEAAEKCAPEEALGLSREALSKGAHPEAHTVAGWALLELGRSAEAVEELERAVVADPENAEALALLGEALFEALRLKEAGDALRRAIGVDKKLAHAHWALGLVEERLGDLGKAGECFRRATRLDREGFPTPFEVAEEEFANLTERAMERLPESFRKELKNLAVIVEPLPPAELIRADPPLSPTILGLHVSGGSLPDTIHLFQRNLQRAARNRLELGEEIETTLLHEIGHYLGLDENEVAQRGLE